MKTTILCLGGIPTERLPEALRQFKLNPKTQLICTGVGDSQRPWVEAQCAAAGVPKSQLIIDGMGPWDTVTEFTMTLDWIRKYGSRRVLIVTSDWHMPRAKAIAQAAYFLNGINFQCCPTYSATPARTFEEDAQWITYDRNRTIKWRITGVLEYDADLRKARQPWWDGQ